MVPPRSAPPARGGPPKRATPGRGIGPTYEDKVGRYGVRIGDLLDRDLLRHRLEMVAPVQDRKLDCASGGEAPSLDVEVLVAQGAAWGDALRPHVADTVGYLDDQMRAGRSVLFEGAQGTMLDIDHGTYPFVTSSNTVAGGACCGAGVGPTRIQSVLGVVKAYTTRVGEGPFPTEDDGEEAALLQTRGGEVGATTGRTRRCGWFDAVIVRRSAIINGTTGIVLTKLDVLSGTGTLKLATSYQLDGQTVTAPPASVEQLSRCQPVYEEMPGWSEDITGVRNFQDLPEAARDYVHRIEELVGTPVQMISVGPQREQIIGRFDPFGG